jgi:acetoin utilization protein AcuB
VWCFTTAITEWTAIEQVVQLADHLERVLAATEAIMRVKDLRTRAVVTVEPEASVVEARRLMQEKRIRHLPVVDAGRHVLVMVTDRDIRLNRASPAATLSVWELNYLLAKLTVGDVMTRTVIVVEPDRDAREAARLLIAEQIRALPVVENGLLVGIVTETDFLRAFVAGEAAGI